MTNLLFLAGSIGNPVYLIKRTVYHIPFNFRDHLIFARFMCAKCKGAIFAQNGGNNRPKTITIALQNDNDLYGKA